MLKVDGQEVARTTVKRTVPAAFSASETFDVGVDLGSTVSLDYFDRRPFKFDGKIEKGRGEAKLNQPITVGHHSQAMMHAVRNGLYALSVEYRMALKAAIWRRGAARRHDPRWRLALLFRWQLQLLRRQVER